MRERKEKKDAETKLKEGTKRKRGDVEQDDIKLKEFLEVMQPANKAKQWTAGQVDDTAIEPPTKVQAIEVPEGESDGEYEAVPKKVRHSSPPKSSVAVEVPVVVEETVTSEVPQEQPPANTTIADATDDDWLRSRTNRLLDLVGPEDLAAPDKQHEPKDTMPFEAFDDEPVLPSNQHSTLADAMSEAEEEEQEKEDPTIVAIRSNGRLFVRNLPYTATEDDLRAHFATYGALDEVSLPRFH